MKSILRKITILFFVSVSFNLFGCKTSHHQEPNNIQSDADTHAEDGMQQVNPFVEPLAAIPDIVEGPVPPDNKNITMYYYVQKGDTLLKIAHKIYGNSASWKKLAESNNLKNANEIFAGDILHYELAKSTKSFSEAYENVPKGKIIVKKGDTLSHVSKAVFGNVAEWRVLWKENPNIVDPDKIKVGQEIYFKPKALKIKNDITINHTQKNTVELQNVNQ